MKNNRKKISGHDKKLHLPGFQLKVPKEQIGACASSLQTLNYRIKPTLSSEIELKLKLN